GGAGGEAGGIDPFHARVSSGEDQKDADPGGFAERGRGEAGGEIEIRGAHFMSILAILEQRAGAWHRMSWETLAAAQQLGAELQQPVSAAVVGDNVAAPAGELAGKKLERVHAVEHALLKDYTPDGYSAALRQLIGTAKPRIVL